MISEFSSPTRTFLMIRIRTFIFTELVELQLKTLSFYVGLRNGNHPRSSSCDHSSSCRLIVLCVLTNIENIHSWNVDPTSINFYKHSRRTDVRCSHAG